MIENLSKEMSEKSLKFKTKYKTTNEETNDNQIEETIESNNKVIESSLMTANDTVEEDDNYNNTENLDQTKSETISVNTCKVCNNEDISTQFFASGPFYAIDSTVEQMAQNVNRSDLNHRRERSDKCNVLYAEMPHIFGDDIHLSHNNELKIQMSDPNGVHCNNECQSQDLDQHLDQNYQLLCYNCCSPLSLDEETQLNHNLYYISSEESNNETKEQMSEADEEHRSSLSSPIMLKFCKESLEQLEPKLSTDELISSEKQSNYTTVIKPKAVRPHFESETNGQSADNAIRSELLRSTLPTLSFHGSATVLTDSDESAFTQIPRRRSNSEATHHYQSIIDDSNRRVYTTTDNSRPLKRHQRSKSVNKTYNNWNNSFTNCQSFSDKHLTQNESNNRFYFNSKTNFSENPLKQKSSVQMLSSEPIHMTLEEVKNIFTKNQTKRTKNAFFIQKHKRYSNDFEDRNKSRSKSKIKCAIESLFRNKRKSDSPIPTNDPNIESETNDKISVNDSEEMVSNQYLSDSTSPFTHRALPPLPNNEVNAIGKGNESMSKEEEDERQKFLDYAASIERVKDVRYFSQLFSFLIFLMLCQ